MSEEARVQEAFEKWIHQWIITFEYDDFCCQYKPESVQYSWLGWQAGVSWQACAQPSDRIINAQLHRCLARLHLAVKACGSIGFEESSPTTNAHHASIWNDLNEAQKDAALKLKHYLNSVQAEEGQASASQPSEWVPVSERLPEDKQNVIGWHTEHMSGPIIVRYIGGRQFHDFFKNWVAITHWQPLPSPPKEREK